MKILHHGCVYPNYCKCNQCGCEFTYDDNETIHTLQPFLTNSIRPIVWTNIQCPECKSINTIYHYKGKIDKVRKYEWLGKYQEIDFDENTMVRR